MRGGRGRKLKSEINVVPYIDVMLVLLIIFMVMPSANDPSVVDLPRAEKSTKPPSDYVQIVLKPNGALSIGVKGKGEDAPETAPNRDALVRKLRVVMGRSVRIDPFVVSASTVAAYDCGTMTVMLPFVVSNSMSLPATT